MSNDIEQQLIELSHAWDRAMASNDADSIGAFMHDDWVIIGSDGRMHGKEAFLGLARSGVMTHDIMSSDDFRIRVYHDACVVTARGVSGGTWQGERFREVERVTSVFVREGTKWLCVLTQLARLDPDGS